MVLWIVMVCLEFSRHLIKGGWSQQNLWHFAVGFKTPNMYMLVTTEQNELDPLCWRKASGHSKLSCCWVSHPQLFVGDSRFCGLCWIVSVKFFMRSYFCHSIVCCWVEGPQHCVGDSLFNWIAWQKISLMINMCFYF